MHCYSEEGYRATDGNWGETKTVEYASRFLQEKVIDTQEKVMLKS